MDIEGSSVRRLVLPVTFVGAAFALSPQAVLATGKSRGRAASATWLGKESGTALHPSTSACVPPSPAPGCAAECGPSGVLLDGRPLSNLTNGALFKSNAS